jgi:glucose-1-phosphate thymidylyltransferase
MKAVIMAGGYATRLWPITKTKAKPLLPVGRKTIIDVIYEKVKKFGPVVISTNRTFGSDFRAWARIFHVELVVENSTKEEEKLGAVRALSEVAKALDDDLLVVAGDNLFTFALDEFVEFYLRKGKPTIALYDVGDYQLARRYGVVKLNGNKVVEL